LASNAGGAANQANISPSNIKDLIIPIPPLPEQKDIASILSALDDKIELNNQMNKKLEQMTQAIFKSWFVDFEPFKDGEFEDSELGRIPKGWKIGRLGDSADITMGQSPAGSSFNEKGIGTIFYQGRTDFGFRFPKIRLYTTEPKRMASKGDILLSVRAPVGDLNIANNDCCLGRGVASIRSKSSCNSYIYYLLKNIKDSFDVYNGEGTIFGSINKDALNNIKVKIPTDFIIHKFQKVVNECDIKIENNSNQTQILTCIRDSLLTKLMSGEIRVPMED
jgi:type I restriction enzyme S subunit